MKRLITVATGLLLTLHLQAQTLSEKVMQQTCDCVSELTSLQQLQDSLQDCTTKAMVAVMQAGTAEERETLGRVEGITGVFKDVKEQLPDYCYNMRRLVVEGKTKEFYKLSANSKANKHYDTGNQLMDRGDYPGAIKAFEKAVKLDRNFVYAIDHIAVAYRRQENFAEAVKYYQQSLEVFPEGNLAHLNIAVAYTFLNDYDNALKHYKQLAYLYQDDPEGYFGAGKIFMLQANYADALDNLFTAHRMYEKAGSAYKQDSEKLITIVYGELKNKGQLDLFMQKAKEFNIEIN
ncbi:tetratricopeptide repeat protein [Pontibacter sp. Tf4]|uniref:tetratricopeptide repeat protein n=1 Tax=Pontibacter sp. Tf4 TaxID=2761620 RepID=UPI00162A3D09|nr:tetratricopeptide repeat protein [Pontibacter sp. Tf4]MBB6609815.1 tetratricopeptide repeat protein [Pontibacter sp. Tf4]